MLLKSGVSEIDPTKLKFVLYARKSTEESDRQVHSIENQLEDCRKYAANNGLNVVEEITEQKSARYSHNRPKFTEMLKKLEAGDYDAVIAWHPDRLARNMLEAGTLLDMLTPAKGAKEPVLKGMVFPTGNFENNSSGRLALAVTFSLATQYSEHLSEQVTSGHRKNLKRGKSSGTPKWGYVRDNRNFYVPDDNYAGVKEGWKMILAGKSQAEVLERWKKLGVVRKTKPDEDGIRKIIKPTKQILTKLFRDPIACGLLVQAGDVVDLCEKQPDFQPMITKEEYDKVQAILDGRYQTHRKHSKSTVFLPLKGMVFCDVCGSKMYPGASSGSGKTRKTIYYTCQNKACTRKKRGVRGFVIFDDILKTLSSMKLDKQSYDEYSKAVDEYAETEIAELKIERSSLLGAKNQYEAELKAENKNFANMSDPALKTPKATLKACRERINELTTTIDDIESDIKAINGQLKDPASRRLTRDEFFNLVQTSGDRIKKGTFAEKDAIVRKIFLNLRITDKNELIYLCNPEFDGLFSAPNVVNGQGDQT